MAESSGSSQMSQVTVAALARLRLDGPGEGAMPDNWLERHRDDVLAVWAELGCVGAGRAIGLQPSTLDRWRRHHDIPLPLAGDPPPPPASPPIPEAPLAPLPQFLIEHCTDIGGDELIFLSEKCYDKCIVGIVEIFGRPPVVCYDKELLLGAMVEEGMEDLEEALEHFEFNVLGSWMGELTPVFLTKVY